MDEFADKLRKNILYGFGIILLCLFTYLVFEQKDGQLLTLLAAVFCVIGTRIADIIKFKLSAGGLEAEMKSVLKDAEVTIKQLHLLVEEFSKVTLESIQAEGRYGGGTTMQKKDAKRAAIILTLEKLGVSSERIAQIIAVEHPYIRFDYYGYIFRNFGRDFPSDKRVKLNEFSAKYNQGIGHEPSPQVIEDFLKSIDELKGEPAEWLEDYKYFLKHEEHRRPDKWAGRA